MFCESCGTKLEDGAKFCENCGAPVANASRVQPEEEAIAEVYTEPAETVSTTVEDAAGSYEQPHYDFGNTSYTGPVDSVVASGPHAFSIVSMICGILSLVCCCIGGFSLVAGIVAIVFGILSLVQARGGKGMALAGLICGALGALLAVIVLAFGAAEKESVTDYLEKVPGMEDVMDELDLDL